MRKVLAPVPVAAGAGVGEDVARAGQVFVELGQHLLDLHRRLVKLARVVPRLHSVVQRAHRRLRTDLVLGVDVSVVL